MPASYKAKHSNGSNNAEGLAETTSVMRECPTAQTSIVGIVTVQLHETLCHGQLTHNLD
jgi:hypothetical protein